MTTAKRISKILEPHGFMQHQEPGFVGWHRTHEDGRRQVLHVFFWSNPKYAAGVGIPHAYIVVVPTIDAKTVPGDDRCARHEDGRFIIPTIDREGQRIAWDVAGTQFQNIVSPLFDAPVEIGRALVREAITTNLLT
ncbi:hypothetical protein [Rathayibacter iranicus]|uniref:Uncharacterized protein n=2 Tax=Rathayibacter iranicus TaxID=59737 RepID=A0AAD1ADB3_9MICO|nr:hypothetical protein [Rathayibacter iranicus]AZZ54965.1 hypothetical protein C7V51_03005 [Rathayibacter iranicus]MWV32312.1 hypothetical protein [Rathayibacter iranicus NCPPB 2253 = VKM Ac-1602]PPI62349.1 hypothetical protein C5E08_03010 [Rathayibacter iranicus]PWJ61070.1 hypothetical protein B0H03_1208 [Rathayibacter iranicus NCPPB 2253 = VKM Ac-1602]